jgi:hypothetical protein
MEGLPVGRILKEANAWDFPRRLGVGGKRCHEEGKAEDDDECNGTARYGRLLSSRTYVGILRVMCWGRKSNFADELGLLAIFRETGLF